MSEIYWLAINGLGSLTALDIYWLLIIPMHPIVYYLYKAVYLLSIKHNCNKLNKLCIYWGGYGPFIVLLSGFMIGIYRNDLPTMKEFIFFIPLITISVVMAACQYNCAKKIKAYLAINKSPKEPS